MWHWSLKATCIECQYFLLNEWLINFHKEPSFLLDKVCVHVLIDDFHGAWLLFRRTKVRCAFGAAVYEIQTSFYHQCQKIKEASSLKMLYSCLFILCLPSGSRCLSIQKAHK